MAGWPSGQNSVPWLVLLTVGSVLSNKPAFSGLFFALHLYTQVISSASCWIRYDPLDSSVLTFANARFGAADTSLLQGHLGKVIHY